MRQRVVSIKGREKERRGLACLPKRMQSKGEESLLNSIANFLSNPKDEGEESKNEDARKERRKQGERGRWRIYKRILGSWQRSTAYHFVLFSLAFDAWIDFLLYLMINEWISSMEPKSTCNLTWVVQQPRRVEDWMVKGTMTSSVRTNETCCFGIGELS